MRATSTGRRSQPETRQAMKQLLKRSAAARGVHLHTDASLPTGVNWLHDVRRSGLLGPAPQFFDVGANTGQTVSEIVSAFPDAMVHAFEPFADPFARLSALCTNLPRVTPVQLALGAEPGVLQVQPREKSVLNSLLPQTGAVGTGAHETIRVDTVDNFCRTRGLGPIDVLKSDTEGYDLEVLRGAQAMLSAHDVVFVYLEVSFHRGNRQNTAFQPAFTLLTDLGYRFLGLYETYSLHHFEEPNLFCNALFLSRSAFARSANGLREGQRA